MIKEVTKVEYSTPAFVAFLFSIALKVFLDTVSFIVFYYAMHFFIKKKMESLRKEALGFSPFNLFILFMIGLLFFMRILGSLFTLTNALFSILSFYNGQIYINYRLVMGDIVFPIRDFVEIMMFSYLFYFQSQKRKTSLAKVNETYMKEL